MVRRTVWNPTLRKNREEWGTTPSYNQGFTQKHPWLLHLKTNPGWQVITKLPDEIRELLACCA